MYRIIFILFIAVVLIITGCFKNPIEPTIGTINLQLIWTDDGSHGLKKLNRMTGDPIYIKVTLNPGSREYQFNYQDHSGRITDLDAGTYSVTVYALDANMNRTHEGSQSGIAVQAGKETTVAITMRRPIPTAPTGVTASTNNENYIAVSWNSSPAATGYKIYRGEDGGSTYSYVETTILTSWNDENVLQAKRYYYKISAFSDAGESSQSGYAVGYRKGWRFDEVSIYNPTDGIGLYYDLYAYGFLNSSKMAAIYAVYDDGSAYYFVPGYGQFGYAAYTYVYTPPYEITFWDNSSWYIYDSYWDPSFQNNYYKQYIKMRIYKTDNITGLTDPYYDQTAYYEISWGSNALGKPMLNIGRKLSQEESEIIDRSLKKNLQPDREHKSKIQNNSPQF